MIWSVSTSLRSSGTARDTISVPAARGSSVEVVGSGEVTGDRGGGGDRRATRGGCDRPCPADPRSCGSRSTRCARPPLSLSGFIARHIEQPASGRQSNPASVNTASSPFGLGRRLHLHRARHDQRPHPVTDLPPAHDLGRGPQVLEAGVRARPDEHGVDLDVADRRACLQAHVSERPAGRLAAATARRTRRGRGRRRRCRRPGSGWCPS